MACSDAQVLPWDPKETMSGTRLTIMSDSVLNLYSTAGAKKCELEASQWLRPMFSTAELHCQGGARFDFFEEWARRNPYYTGAPDRTLIIFYTTNDLANR
jgi:hypothetical protein